MKPRQLREAVRARAKALRESVGLRRRQLRAQVDQLPAVRRERTRKRRRRALVTALLLLLLCLIRCDCDPVVPVPGVGEKTQPEVKPKAPVDAGTPKPRPFRAKVDPQPRPGFSGDDPNAPKWLDDFRLQVAARSPRLGACFTGTERPGALRWTTAVNPESGAVSDHLIEPLGTGGDLQNEQRTCVIRALSAPAYRLGAAAQKQGLPNRVSIVIEF